MHVVKPGIAGATFVFVIRIVFSSARGTHPSIDGQFSLEVWAYIYLMPIIDLKRRFIVGLQFSNSLEMKNQTTLLQANHSNL
ncbi:MAG: hypothetical protein DA446_08200 [Bacteroidetes bacterium]|nr:MAG: hypothetical protein DA443_06210 [Bacteroidota bacterium]PTM19489.1 MAG: hypothetical protein DA446_08165 [Bacteroidota bacterium]PTM19496.1 MAG: hypothetical protein DA446_08200 [Bacteroidota bacterium]